PAFRDLRLEDHGLRWALGEIESCHPAPDGTYAVISRDHDVTARHFGSPEDGERWRQVATWYASIEPQIIDLLMRTFPASGVLVRDDRACGVRLFDGTEITARAILADTDVAALLLDLVEREHVPARVIEFMQRYPRGWGTFKVDWALAKPVPWTCELARKSAVVHAADSL